MGSVQDVNGCKKCGGVFESVTYYKTGDYYGACNRCGYFEEQVTTRGNTGEPVYASQNGGGFGILCVGGEAMRLDSDAPEAIMDAWAVIESEPGETCELLTIMVNGKLKCLNGTMPKSYAELVSSFEKQPSGSNEAEPVVAGGMRDDAYPF